MAEKLKYYNKTVEELKKEGYQPAQCHVCIHIRFNTSSPLHPNGINLCDSHRNGDGSLGTAYSDMSLRGMEPLEWCKEFELPRCPFYKECTNEKTPYWCESDAKFMVCGEYQKRRVIKEFAEWGYATCPRCGRRLTTSNDKLRCKVCGVLFSKNL